MKKIIIILLLLSSVYLIFSDESNDTTSSASASNKDTKTIQGLTAAHAVLGTLTYLDFLATDILGTTMLTLDFTDQKRSSNYSTIKHIHTGVSLSSFLFYFTQMSLSYVDLGYKIKNGIPVNYIHFISSTVTTAMVIIELLSSIATAIVYSYNLDCAKWVGLSHGIICGLTTVSFTVTAFILYFGNNNKKVISFSKT
jgi:hypothetical protein